jgi:hypothetical protein
MLGLQSTGFQEVVMSQLSQPLVAPPRVRTRPAALLALAAAAGAVALVLALDGGSTAAVPVGGKANPLQHSSAAAIPDGFATAVSSQSLLPAAAGRPDESRVAAAIAPARAAGRPDESRVAAAIAGR